MSASPQNPRSRLDSAVPNRLPAWSPRPVWEGLAVALLAVTVAIYGSIVVGREGADRAPLLGMREGLELLRVERDVSIAAAAYDATLTLHMYEGGHAEELARRGETLRRSMLDAAARLDSIAPSDSWNPTHEHMREAVGTALATFDRPSSSNERSSWLTEFLYDFKRVIPTDNLGEWTALLEVATWSQEVPLVLEEYLEVAMAREWQRTRRAPADSDLIESYNTSLASMRQLRESHGAEAETYTPFEEYILPELAEQVDPRTVELLARLAAHPGVRAHESDMPYLLSLTGEHEFESVGDVYARLDVWVPEIAGLMESIRSHAIHRLDVAITASARRSAVAKYGGITSILLGVIFAIRLIRGRLRVDRHLRTALEVDPLTGLSNRYALFSNAPARLADPRQRNFALIHVDLDDFKSINDDFGHHMGDQALVGFASALRGAVRSATDLVCRVGGDEFVVLLQRLDDPEEGAADVIARLKTALETPIEIEAISLRLHFTAGVAIAREDVDLEELLVEADLALLDAKERGRDVARFFRRKLGRRMIHELSTALGSGELQCAFQPQLDLHTGAVVGLEALARWQRADRVQVPTRSLIDALEWLGASREWLRVAMTDIEEVWRACGERVDGYQ